MKLTIDHISKQFSDYTAVNNVSLDLSPGIWGLLGANGAGKTTLIRMITDITTPSSGQILYDGVPITTLKESYRDILGYLPQEFGFYPSFTVNDYLEYMAALKGLPGDMTKKKITELLERLNLIDVRRKKLPSFPAACVVVSALLKHCSTILKCSSLMSQPVASIPANASAYVISSPNLHKIASSSFPHTLSPTSKISPIKLPL